MPKRGHEFWMAEALALARRAEGLTRPNPPVGAVIVRHGRVVGRGFHRKAGDAHAEIHALREAGDKARGATLYVTLEPCSTWGRTPPCTDAIKAAGLARVIVGCRDPNPAHAGRGIRILRNAGIAVVDRVCEAEAKALIDAFGKWITQKKPVVTLKLGMTLDGRIADRKGGSRWITGRKARMNVHALRRRVDAIMVGVGTAIADDPSLLPAPARGRKPYRVIVDSRGRLPLRSKCLRDGHAGQTVVATTKRAKASFVTSVRKAGAAVVVLPSVRDRVALSALMRELGRMGIMHVLCEGGGELAATLVREKLVDEFLFFMGPKLLGGAGAIPAIGGEGWLLGQAPVLEVTAVERIGGDILIRAKRS